MQFQRKIQLISADSQLRKQLEIVLLENGYFPVVAKNWKDAEENYGAESPLIALIDFRLPSGVQIVQNSKEASPTTECIVMTDELHHPSVTEAINIGASNFLLLPPDTDQLLAILRRTLEHYQIQQLYRESEARFRSIVETIDDAIILMGIDGNIFYWNDAAAATFGYSKGDLINKSIENILKEEEREIFQRDFQKFVDKGGQPIDQFPFRYMGIQNNGTTFPVELVLLFFEADGKKYFTATVHDLTSQVEIRDELEKKEQIFKNMVDGSPMGVHIYHLDADGQLIFAAANSSAGEILGMDNSQYIGKTIAEVFPSLVQTEIPERYRRAASLGESWHSEQISYKDENIDGVFEVHVFQTSPGNAAVLFSDVTERIQTVEQLRIQSAALNAAATGIIITGFEGKIIWANPAMETLTGYSIDEIVGRSPEIFSSGYHDETFYQKMGQVVHTNKIWRGEIINRRKDGSVYPEYQIIAPVQNEDGDFTHYIAIKQDISERKQAEAAIKASEERFITIFQSSPNPVSITSFPNSAFIDVNESFLQASGYNREEIIGKPVAEIGFWTSIEDRNFVFNTLQKEKRITNYEMNYRRKNGEISTALISADFINLDGENFLLTSYYDIFDRKQAETEIQRRIRQLASINEMGQLVASSLELSQVFEKVVRAIPSLVDAEWVTVLLLEYQGELVVKAVGGEGGEKLLDKRIPSTEGLAGEVVRSEQPVLVGGASSENQIDHYLNDEFKISVHSLLLVPLILGGNLIGVMEAIHSEANKFDIGDLEVMGTAATWVAIAIANARQHEALQRRLQESQALASISQALNETLDLDRVLELIVDSARRIIPQAERAVIHLYSDSKKLLEPIAASSKFDMGDPYLTMKSGEGVSGQVMDSGMTINIRDTEKDPRFLPVTGRTAFYLRSLLSTPVQSGERRLGTISISSATPDAFSGDDSHILSILGVQAALAIESARLFEETRQRAHYLELLNDMTSSALRIPDLDTILQSLAGQLVELFDADGCYITLWNEEKQSARLTATHGADIEEFSNEEISSAEITMTRSVLEAGTILVAEDVFNTPYLSPKIAAQYPAKSLMALPLIADDKKLGAALIAYNQPHIFTEDEVWRGELISQQVTLAIAKTQILEAEQKRRQEAETLRKVATTISSTLEIDIVLEQILTSLEQVIPYDSAGIILIESNSYYIMAGRGFDNLDKVIGQALPEDSQLLSQVREKREAIIVDDVQNDPSWKSANEFRYVRSWIGTPLIAQQVVIGFLTIDNQKPGIYNEADAALAQVFANQAAIAIQNARLFDATRRRLSEVNTLYRINNQIVASLDFDVDKILHEVVNMLWSDFNYYHVHVYMLNREKNILIVQQGSGPIGEQLARQSYNLSAEEGVVGYVATVGDIFMSNDVSAVHFYKSNLLLPETHAEMAAPLRARGQLLGVLDIQHRTPNIFTEDDVRLIQLVADQLAIVLDKALLYAELEAALTKEKSIRAQLVQSEKLAAMGRLVASVAHELNNPLQAIQNALYLVKMEEKLSSQATEDLQVALDETNRMGNLISRLRDTYRPAGPEEFKMENLNDIVFDVHRLIGTHLRHANITFEFISDKDLPATLLNSDHIKQVVLNLCMNGIESMPTGGQLTVETQNLPENQQVLLKVTDSGPGIAAEIIPHIFEPFFTTKQKGTGLGLYISYEIVENHAGSLKVFSDGQYGATFQLILPAENEIDFSQLRSIG